MQWDFDGDGKVDKTGDTAVHPFPGPGKYKVTMWLTDAVFGKTSKVSKTVKVGGDQ